MARLWFLEKVTCFPGFLTASCTAVCKHTRACPLPRGCGECWVHLQEPAVPVRVKHCVCWWLTAGWHDSGVCRPQWGCTWEVRGRPALLVLWPPPVRPETLELGNVGK